MADRVVVEYMIALAEAIRPLGPAFESAVGLLST
jgi:hypothetical protein